MRNLTCDRCGAEFEVTEHKVATSDRGSFQCECGNTLMRRKEVAFYTIKLIKLGEEPDSANQSK